MEKLTNNYRYISLFILIMCILTVVTITKLPYGFCKFISWMGSCEDSIKY